MDKRSIGNLGESVSCRFLQAHGYRIEARNYRKKWGEVDIIGIKDGEVAFFEVKSGTFSSVADASDVHVPEENVHASKTMKLRRMVKTYLMETGRRADAPFSFHVLSVYLDLKRQKSRIKWIRDVIL